MKTDKGILDPCCGSRMMWFDKSNPKVVFADKRSESYILSDGRSLQVTPDIVHDFTKMKFDNESFSVVAFDPPHIKGAGKNSWLAKKYGSLDKSWADLIRDGFKECMRVLKPGGCLIFKWNETSIPVSKIIEAIGTQPEFGHTSGRQSKTIWMVFVK